MSDFSSQLFSYLPEEGIKAFSCGHVIPVNNLQTLVLTQGPRKTDLVWKFDQRGNKEMVCLDKLRPSPLCTFNLSDLTNTLLRYLKK